MNHAHDVRLLAVTAAESSDASVVSPAVALTRWLDVAEAAEWVGVPAERVRRAIARRRLPAVSSHPARPGHWMVRLDDLEAWAGGVGGGAGPG